MIGWLLAGVGLAIAWWGIRSTRRTLHPVSTPFPAPDPFPPYRRVALTGLDGASFDLWVFEAEPPRGVVVACHGYHASRLQLVELADRLRRRGYTVILFDLRGHETRPGRCSFGVEDVQDLEAIRQWIRRQPALAPQPLGLLGFSLGGAVACQAALRMPDLHGVVLDSTYARLFPILAKAIRRDYRLPAVPWAWITWLGVQLALGRRLAARDPLVLAAQCPQPALIIHGAQDAAVPIQDAQAIFARWRGPKDLWIEPQAKHVGAFAADPTAYTQRVAEFLDRWLLRAPPSSPS
ncbi:MAG: alpha/beta fold hydrolase [Candidatus Omnitrophica bacterium]|nr:alpha/beta fold hydrolase [Candidatus Omnitrophota bacterium]